MEQVSRRGKYIKQDLIEPIECERLPRLCAILEGLASVGFTLAIFDTAGADNAAARFVAESQTFAFCRRAQRVWMLMRPQRHFERSFWQSAKLHLCLTNVPQPTEVRELAIPQRTSLA